MNHFTVSVSVVFGSLKRRVTATFLLFPDTFVSPDAPPCLSVRSPCPLPPAASALPSDRGRPVLPVPHERNRTVCELVCLFCHQARCFQESPGQRVSELASLMAGDVLSYGESTSLRQVPEAPALPLLFLPCVAQLLAFRHEQLLPCPVSFCLGCRPGG